MSISPKLKRELSPFDLVMLGVGCIIGVGIFIASGEVAANYAGSAVIISFLLAALLCAIVGFCYGELASVFPLAGSAYSYAYHVFDRKVAWFLGWTLVLEYIVAASAVASGWSAYFKKFLEVSLGIVLPAKLTTPPGQLPGEWSINILPLFILSILTIVLVLGMKMSAKFNNYVTGFTVFVLLVFIVLGVEHLNPQNWQPFIPDRVSGLKEVSSLERTFWEWLRSLFMGEDSAFRQVGHYGWQGVLTGTAIVFFSYIGFDMLSSVSEESKNPQKDVPFSIVMSLALVTALYTVVALVLTGIVPSVLDGQPNPLLTGDSAPLAVALGHVSHHPKLSSAFISLGAIAGSTTTLLAMSLGISRILLAISRDRFLPGAISKLHSKFATPYIAIVIVNILMSLASMLLPIGKLLELCNLGTLAAFLFVCLSVIILRKLQPSQKRAFVCPGSPWLPGFGVIFCAVLLFSLPALTWIWFVVWLLIGALVYVFYGRKKASRSPYKHNL